MSETLYELLPWILFNLFILIMLAVDLSFHKKAHVISVREAAKWSIFWISLALIFNLYIYYARGAENALNFLTGYTIEKALSVDNLFVFLLIFNYFRTPAYALHKVLFWGVLSAIVLRALFIYLGIELISHFHWIIYLFGLFLIATGIKFALRKDEQVNIEDNPLIRLCRKFIPVTENYDEAFFFSLRQGRYYATPLFLALLAIETTDLIFALDSIPAILAITHDPFIVYTSNIFAILGLRSLYFVLSEIMILFHHLHYGLSLILVLIGTKMIAVDFVEIPTVITLGIIFFILLISIIASVLFPPR